MKNEVISELAKIGKKDKNLVFMTGDVGYNAVEPIRDAIGNRFINAGIAEQNMVSVAAGLAYMGMVPWVYSITPFVTYKVLEQIRNDVCIANLDVKIVGNGGGYGYGIMGHTHHALDDISILSNFENLKIFSPGFFEDIPFIIKKMHKNKMPSYLRLNLAEKQEFFNGYSDFRKITSGQIVTVVVLGHLIHNVLKILPTLKDRTVDLWLITEIPFTITTEFLNSIRHTQNLIVIEEHSESGGIGSRLTSALFSEKLNVKRFTHLCARGYKSHLYGSQKFHWEENDLHPEGILKHISLLTK